MRCGGLLLIVIAGCAADAGDRRAAAATGASGEAARPTTMPGDPPAAERSAGGEREGCAHPVRVAPEPGQCDGLPEGYGLSPLHPLEWGTSAMLGLGGDALLCENGGRPTWQRGGSVQAPPEYQPAAPLSKLGDADLIDHYEVTCPGDAAPRSWYVNSYRCGAPCFPRGFRAMNREAYDGVVGALQALEQGQTDEALRLAQRAYALEPASEIVNARLGTALFVAERYDEAFEHHQRASAIDPKNFYYRLHAAMAKLAAGDSRYYRIVVEQLLAELPDDHQLVDELHCRHAHALRRDDELDRASQLAAHACAAGEKECCW